MFRRLRAFFIPCSQNSYKPRVLRRAAVGGMLGLIVLTFTIANLQSLVLQHSSWFAAKVIPAVVFNLTNESRAQAAEASLARNALLDEAARLKAEDMAARGYFSHTSPEGIEPWHWFDAVGYEYRFAGENLAVHFVDSGEVMEAWMASPGHRANILGSQYTEIGIGTAQGRYEGYDTVFVVQLFGAPRYGGTHAAPVSHQTSAETPTHSDPVGVVLAEQREGAAATATRPFSSGEPSMEAVGETVAHPRSFVSASDTILATLAQPSLWLMMLYSMIALFVLVCLALAIVVEWQRQHPVQIAYGVGLLGVLGGLLYLHTWATSGVLIA